MSTKNIATVHPFRVIKQVVSFPLTTTFNFFELIEGDPFEVVIGKGRSQYRLRILAKNLEKDFEQKTFNFEAVILSSRGGGHQNHPLTKFIYRKGDRILSAVLPMDGKTGVAYPV